MHNFRVGDVFSYKDNDLMVFIELNNQGLLDCVDYAEGFSFGYCYKNIDTHLTYLLKQNMLIYEGNVFDHNQPIHFIGQIGIDHIELNTKVDFDKYMDNINLCRCDTYTVFNFGCKCGGK